MSEDERQCQICKDARATKFKDHDNGTLDYCDNCDSNSDLIKALGLDIDDLDQCDLMALFELETGERPD